MKRPIQFAAIPFAAVALLLTACGASPDKRAVDACQKAIAEKMTGKSYEIDPKDMLVKLQKQDNNTVSITSMLFLDKGLPAETKQSFECRVQFDPANPKAEPSIVGLTFTWQ